MLAGSVPLVTVGGTATVAFGILVKVSGIPDQIRQNFKRKLTEGVSFVNQAPDFSPISFGPCTDCCATIRCLFVAKRSVFLPAAVYFADARFTPVAGTEH